MIIIVIMNIHIINIHTIWSQTKSSQVEMAKGKENNFMHFSSFAWPEKELLWILECTWVLYAEIFGMEWAKLWIYVGMTTTMIWRCSYFIHRIRIWVLMRPNRQILSLVHLFDDHLYFASRGFKGIKQNRKLSLTLGLLDMFRGKKNETLFDIFVAFARPKHPGAYFSWLFKVFFYQIEKRLKKIRFLDVKFR